MPFAQLVIGSPGSGKTTYCYGLSQFLPLLSRPCSIVNLDPANDLLPYPCAVDINQLISVRDVMAELHLGPNAAMLYCIEYLEKNIDWLIDQLDRVIREQRSGHLSVTQYSPAPPTGPDANVHGSTASPSAAADLSAIPQATHEQQTQTIEPVPAGSEYIVFDLPGQVELSTNHPSLRRILSVLESRLAFRFVAVHMTDATHITDPSRYVSLLLLALRAMLALELPHVNVLSKVDLLGQHSRTVGLSSTPDTGATTDPKGTSRDDDDDDGGQGDTPSTDLAFNLDFYTQVQDLSYLTNLLLHPTASSVPSRRTKRFAELNRTICDLVEDFGLVQFETLAVEDRRSMFRLVQMLDKAVGYVYVAEQGGGWDPSEEDDVATSQDGAGRYEPGSAQATAASALRTGPSGRGGGAAEQGGATARSLFTTADRGVPQGWGDALEVQERYVDHRDLYDRYEMEREKEVHDRLWEDRVWSEVRKATAAQTGAAGSPEENDRQ